MATAVQEVKKPGIGASVEDVLNYQDELVRTGQFEILGKMKTLVLEPARDANVPGRNETSVVGVRLDWRNEEAPKGGYLENFVQIAQSLDRTMLLCLGAMRRRDGRVGLPDIPDPSWKPGNPTPEQVCPPITGYDERYKSAAHPKGTPIYGAAWAGNQAPMIAQKLEDRCSGYVKGTHTMLFQPVHQILFQPEINQQLQATYWMITGRAADGSTFCHRTRTHLAFLVDAQTGAAHFYGGAWQIQTVG